MVEILSLLVAVVLFGAVCAYAHTKMVDLRAPIASNMSRQRQMGVEILFRKEDPVLEDLKRTKAVLLQIFRRWRAARWCAFFLGTVCLGSAIIYGGQLLGLAPFNWFIGLAAVGLPLTTDVLPLVEVDEKNI